MHSWVNLALKVLLCLCWWKPAQSAIPADQIGCQSDKKYCWDGFNCFDTDWACGGCGDCKKWPNKANLYGKFCKDFYELVGLPAYPYLPAGTRFTQNATEGKDNSHMNYFAVFFDANAPQYSRPTDNYVNVTVICPSGYYPSVSTVTCSYTIESQASSATGLRDVCTTCSSYTVINKNDVCMMCGTWSGIPKCVHGCSPVSLNNGSVTYSRSISNDVYEPGTVASYTCNVGFYLSTNSSTEVGTCDATYNSGNWSLIPTCIVGCSSFTTASPLAVSYSPIIPSFAGGFLLQTTQAIFNCSTGYYLDPPNYIYTCTTSNWNLGAAPPKCQKGCSTISLTFGQAAYSSSTLTYGVYKNTTVATIACSTGYYLSTFTSNTTAYCNGTGEWITLPTCTMGCSSIGALSNGGMSYNNVTTNNVYPVGTLVSFECNNKFYLAPSTLNSTCIGPGWSLSLPACQPGCDPISLLNGNVNYGTATLINGVYKNTTVATITCSSNYFLSTNTDSTTNFCKPDGHWDSIPSCNLGCDPNDPVLQIANGAFGQISSSVTTQLPVVGPSVSSVVSLTSGNLPTLAPLVGLVNNLFRLGTVLNFACIGNNFLSSNDPAVCGSDGRWTNVPSCIGGCLPITNLLTLVSTAPSYPNVSYSSQSGSPVVLSTLFYPSGTVAGFACKSGYYLSGPTTAQCTNGQWTAQPLCLPGCTDSPIVTNMVSLTYSPVPLSSNISFHKNGTTAEYTCNTDSEMVGNGKITCVDGNWTYPIPQCKELPVIYTVVKVLMSLSCTFLVIAIGGIFILTLIIRDFSIETCLHLNEELSLWFAHIILLFLRDRVDLKNICPLASAAVQYFFTVAFTFMTIESLQSLYLLHNIISFGGLCNSPRLVNFLVGWFIPLIPTCMTAATHYTSYPSNHSCWVNLDSEISLFIMVPVFFFFLLTVIITEAAAMGDFHDLPLVSKYQRVAAHVNQKSMTPLVSLSLASWFCGFFAAYKNSPALYSIAVAVNLAFGILLIFFHFIGNPKLNNWLHRTVLRKCCHKSHSEAS